jgi:hypothetical protein
MVETLIGLGELGCSEALPSPPGPGYVVMSTPDGLQWVPAGEGGPTTVDLAVAGGVLTVTVNGVSDSLAGVLVEDAFGVGLGYLLPV